MQCSFLPPYRAPAVVSAPCTSAFLFRELQNDDLVISSSQRTLQALSKRCSRTWIRYYISLDLDILIANPRSSIPPFQDPVTSKQIETMGELIVSPRRLLAGSSKGQVLRMPDLHALFQGWPEGVNVHLQVLRQNVDERLNRFV